MYEHFDLVEENFDDDNLYEDFLDDSEAINQNTSTINPVLEEVEESENEERHKNWTEMVCNAPGFYDVIFHTDPNINPDGGLNTHVQPSFIASKKTLVVCRRKNVEEANIDEVRVQLHDRSGLVKYFMSHNYTDPRVANPHHCAVILFYSTQCIYSMDMAPNYNALARAFPQIDILAVNTHEHPR